MKGLKYFFDDAGEPEAVLIDLKKNRRLWEDVLDILVSKSRLEEPRESQNSVEARLRSLGKLK